MRTVFNTIAVVVIVMIAAIAVSAALADPPKGSNLPPGSGSRDSGKGPQEAPKNPDGNPIGDDPAGKPGEGVVEDPAARLRLAEEDNATSSKRMEDFKKLVLVALARIDALSGPPDVKKEV